MTDLTLSSTHIFVSACIGMLMLAGCNARVEGCLDPEARNFDVTVDKNNPGDCTYPSMLLDVSYRWGDTTFRTGTLYTNDMGQLILVEDAYLLFSQFNFIDNEGIGISVINTTPWQVGVSSQPVELDVPDDFTLVDNARFVFTLGEWNTTTFIGDANFTLGVPDSLTPTDPNNLISSKILDPRVFYNTETMSFALARFTLVRDTSTNDSDIYHISAPPMPFIFEMNKDLNLGIDDTIRLAIDYQKVFGGIDLTADSTSIASQIANALNDAIIDNN